MSKDNDFKEVSLFVRQKLDNCIPSVYSNMVIENEKEQVSTINADNDFDAILIWLNEFSHNKNTISSYKQTIERFMLWLGNEGLGLKDVTREVITKYEDFLQYPTPTEIWCGKAVARNNPNWKPFVKGLSITSVNLNLQILGSMFQYLIEGGYLTKNPFRLIRIKKKSIQKIERYLNENQWQYIKDYIENMPKKTPKDKLVYERARWIFYLFYLTGCRRHEVINAKMSDFYLKNHQWWFKVLGKGNKIGEIPVTNELLECLIRYRKFMGLSDIPTVNENNIPIIFSLFGKLEPILDSALYKIIKNISENVADEIKTKDAGSSYTIRKMSTHWLRHTSATHQVDSGVDIRTVKKNLRHSLLETTMKYQHKEDVAQHNETTSKFKP